MAHPKVSIIITCYNAAPYLRASLDSALVQDYDTIEVIAVDDGSKDETAQILASYKNRIKIITQENAGCAAARNTGLSHATGEIIVILDSDDVLLPDSISSKIDLLHSEPNVGLVTSKTAYIDEQGNVMPQAVDMKPSYEYGVSYIDAMHRLPGPISGWMIPKAIMDELNNFDASLRAVEDYDLCLRILAKYKCLCDPNVRILYREVPGSLSRDYTHNYDHVRKVIRKNRKLAPISRLEYWWHSKVMMLTSCAGVFTRLLKESGKRGPSRLLQFLAKRPSSIPYFVFWSARATYNRVLYKLGKGPLLDKELALKSGTGV
ncbi:MAG TPA: glycosyltransferase [Fimbriimonadaceae bacterium]|jgi:glycosyltransferase involved in cell wall biosynthesis